MGCPKSFSLSGGMGAALLSKPELIHDVLHMLPESCCNWKMHSYVIKVVIILFSNYYIFSFPDFDYITKELGHTSDM